MSDDQAPPARSPWEEFADLLLGVPPVAGGTPAPDPDPAPDGNGSIYDEPSAFELALQLATGGQLGVPDTFEAGDPQPDPDGPRRPRPDLSQGRGSPPASDPATAFGQRLISALDDTPPAPLARRALRSHTWITTRSVPASQRADSVAEMAHRYGWPVHPAAERLRAIAAAAAAVRDTPADADPEPSTRTRSRPAASSTQLAQDRIALAVAAGESTALGRGGFGWRILNPNEQTATVHTVLDLLGELGASAPSAPDTWTRLIDIGCDMAVYGEASFRIDRFEQLRTASGMATDGGMKDRTLADAAKPVGARPPRQLAASS